MRWLLALAFAAAATTASGAVVVRAHWEKKPTPEQLAKYYPADAAKHYVRGWAILECRVGVDGRATDCRAVDEAPQGAGFGDAAIRVITESARFVPATIDGKPVEGDAIRLPVNFAIPRTLLDQAMCSVGRALGDKPCPPEVVPAPKAH